MLILTNGLLSFVIARAVKTLLLWRKQTGVFWRHSCRKSLSSLMITRLLLAPSLYSYVQTSEYTVGETHTATLLPLKRVIVRCKSNALVLLASNASPTVRWDIVSCHVVERAESLMENKNVGWQKLIVVLKSGNRTFTSENKFYIINKYFFRWQLSSC